MTTQNFKKIGSFSKVRRGASPRPIDDPKYFGGDVGWVRIADVTASKKYLRKTTQYVSELGEKNSVRVDKGDLIMSICGTIGRPVIIDIPACIHDGFIQLYDIKDSDTEYLYYSLQFSEEALKAQGQSGTQTNLNTSIVSELEIFHPALEEQTRIAAVLSCVDRSIEQIEALIVKQQRIKAGLMQDLLTKGIDKHGNARSEATHEFKDSPQGWIPKEWEYVRLADYFSLPSGQVDPKQAPYYDWALIAPDHIESATGRLLMIQTAREQGAISGKYQFKAGDVLYSKIRPYLRKAILADRRGLCSADMYPLRANRELAPAFLLALILSESFSRFATAASDRSGFPKLNRNELGEYYTAIPSYDEQIRITSVLNAHDLKLRVEEVSLEKLKKVKAGLMQDLLTGRISADRLLAEQIVVST